MVRKSLVITSVFVLAALAAASTGGLLVNAWNSGASLTCLGTSVITTCTNPQSPTPSFVAGTTVTDTAIIADTNGIDGSCPGSGCVTGTVTFTVYESSSCTGTVLTTSSAISPTGNQYPGIFSWSYMFNTANSYSIKAVYTGNYDDNSATALPCEQLTITPTTHGVPEFPLGSLGMLALIGMMVPLLIAMRSRFMKNLPL